jgi:hypothetical protein
MALVPLCGINALVAARCDKCEQFALAYAPTAIEFVSRNNAIFKQFAEVCLVIICNSCTLFGANKVLFVHRICLPSLKYEGAYFLVSANSIDFFQKNGYTTFRNVFLKNQILLHRLEGCRLRVDSF